VPQDFVTCGVRVGYSEAERRIFPDRRNQGVRMLDLAGILFSSVMMLVVLVQAVRLDRTQPWFQRIKRSDKPVEPTTQTWRRRR
jgi:hypothetical protein